MNARTRVALARVQVAEVVRRMVPRLNAADQRAAVIILLDSVAEVADEMAREAEQIQARTHDYGRLG